jgi:hypothetical protein
VFLSESLSLSLSPSLCLCCLIVYLLQRDDPISDLRATGRLGLAQLVYFVEHYPHLFRAMARHQQQGAGGMEYPFCTAGINITFLLLELFEMKRGMSTAGGVGSIEARAQGNEYEQ